MSDDERDEVLAKFIDCVVSHDLAGAMQLLMVNTDESLWDLARMSVAVKMRFDTGWRP